MWTIFCANISVEAKLGYSAKDLNYFQGKSQQMCKITMR